jgi:hypothetical protein
VSTDRDLPAVLKHGAPVTTATLSSSLAVPRMMADAGDRAAKRVLDFFAASIENDNTRMAYYRAVCSFFAWLEQHGIGELAAIEPFHVAAYIKALKVSEPGDRTVKERAASRPTVKQHLAVVRMLFDRLIVSQVLVINPAHAVRGPKHVGKRGKTPVLTEDQAAAARQHQGGQSDDLAGRVGGGSVLARRPARSRADRRHGLQLCAHQRRRVDAGRGTKLYDRTGDEITLDEVKRIAI